MRKRVSAEVAAQADAGIVGLHARTPNNASQSQQLIPSSGATTSAAHSQGGDSIRAHNVFLDSDDDDDDDDDDD